MRIHSHTITDIGETALPAATFAASIVVVGALTTGPIGAMAALTPTLAILLGCRVPRLQAMPAVQPIAPTPTRRGRLLP
jgi:hypothetical protein